jgi:predicted GNAT family acetyltransferase
VDVTVVDNPERKRFEARTGDEVAGFIDYRVRPDALVLVHTEVLPQYEGQGIGSQLARAVLDEIRARGRRIRVLCPFLTAYLRRHPEYADLVVAQGGQA